METYAKMYAKADKENNLKELKALYKKWKRKGDFIIGAYISRNEVDSGLNEKTYFQYLFDTDDGVIKFHLGTAGDGEIGAQLSAGCVYRIEFDGKLEIGRGRTVNTYICSQIPIDSGPAETEVKTK